jgi:hypothetical protein
MVHAQSAVHNILERKTSDELLGYLQRQADYPAGTIHVVQAILIERGVAISTAPILPRGFTKSLIATCPDCGYHGVMGWSTRRAPDWVWGLRVISIVVTAIASFLTSWALFVGLPSFLLLFVIRRYYAQCPNCKTSLILAGAQVSDVTGSPVP